MNCGRSVQRLGGCGADLARAALARAARGRGRCDAAQVERRAEWHETGSARACVRSPIRAADGTPAGSAFTPAAARPRWRRREAFVVAGAGEAASSRGEVAQLDLTLRHGGKPCPWRGRRRTGDAFACAALCSPWFLYERDEQRTGRSGSMLCARMQLSLLVTECIGDGPLLPAGTESSACYRWPLSNKVIIAQRCHPGPSTRSR